MNHRETHIVTKDEILSRCRICGIDLIVAYWDYEIEYYIFLFDEDCCKNCCKINIKRDEYITGVEWLSV